MSTTIRSPAGCEPLESRLLLASAGEPDPSFGNLGTTTLAFPGGTFEVRSLAIRPDGKTILAGAKAGRLAVARLNVDGTVDASFGGGGLFETAEANRATDVAVQADGMIVVTGIAPRTGGGPDPNRFTTLRILAEGEGLDPGFGNGGVVSRLYGDAGGLGGYCYANAVAIQNDGRIVVGGVAHFDNITYFTNDFLITRYNADGSTDANFGTRPLGLPLGWNNAAMGGDDEILDLAIDYHGDPSSNPRYGSIVAVGNTDNYWGVGHVPEGSQFAVARFNPNGTLDGGLDGDGKLTASFAGAQTAWASGVVIQPGGKIVATGSAGPNSGGRNLALARFHPNGSLDDTFGPGGGGKVQQDLNGDDLGSDSAVSFVGGILVASSTGVAAFTADGFLDPRFSNDGMVLTDARAGIATTGAAIEPVRKLVIAGGNAARRFVDVGPRGALLAGITETHEANGPVLNVIVAADRMPATQRIYIDIGGTATAPYAHQLFNWDYHMGGITLLGFNNDRNYVDIPAGQTHTIVTISPINDARAEGDETIELRVAPDPSYDLGNPSAYTLLIRDDDLLTGPSVSAARFAYETPPQRVTFRFNQDVGASLGAGDFQVTGPAGPVPFALAYDASVNTATLSFAGVLPSGNYTARAVAAGIANAAGQPMAADHVLDFFFLAADANHDRAVNLADFGIVRANFGGSGKTFAQGDFNYDAVVNLADFGILRARFGTTLPPPGGRGLFGGEGGGDDDGGADLLA